MNKGLVGVLLIALLIGAGAGPGRAAPAAQAQPAANFSITALALDAAGNGWAAAFGTNDQAGGNSALLRIENGTWHAAVDSSNAPDVLDPVADIYQIVLLPGGQDGWAIGYIANDGDFPPIFLRLQKGVWGTRKTSFTSAIQLIDLAVAPDGNDGWLTIWDNDIGDYKLLRYRNGAWDYVDEPAGGGALVDVAYSPDGKSAWAVGPRAEAGDTDDIHAAYKLVNGQWQRQAGDVYSTDYYPYSLAVSNAGDAWLLATIYGGEAAATRLHAARAAPLRDDTPTDVVWFLPHSGAPHPLPLTLPPPTSADAYPPSLQGVSIDGNGRGWIAGSYYLGSDTSDPTREKDLYQPFFVRVVGEALTAVPGPALGIAADRNQTPTALAVSPDGAHTWLGSLDGFLQGTLEELHDPWAHDTPPAAAPLPGAGLCFAQVPACLRGVFATYWQAHGGLDQFGYPVTPEVQETQGDQTYTVQYTERARLEWHPEFKGTANEVLLGLLGNALADPRRDGGDTPFADTPASPDPAVQWFSATQHNLGPPFMAYWQAHGGLAVFGLPRSEAFDERNQADGKVYRSQYFERNRLEYHPENAGTKFEFLLGLLGVEQFAQTYGYTP